MLRDSDVLSPRTAFKCSRLRESDVGTTVCQYCAVGCTQLAFFKEGTLINVEGDPRSSVNEGRQCPKGASTFALNENPRRFTKPMYRAAGSDAWKEVSTEWILNAIADRIEKTREANFKATDDAGHLLHSVDSIGFIGGSANDNEECYLFKKLFTGGLGVLPVENSARYCHSTTVAALSPTFGFGASTNPPRDLLNSDFILIMGSNMAEAHPVAFYWVMQAKKRGTVTMHVDPRYTRTSACCDHHAPIRPGTDIAFLGAVIRIILEKGYWFKDYVLHYTNAATLINENYAFDAVTGLFDGWDAEKKSYAAKPDSWDYQYEILPDGSRGEPKRDLTMQDPQCVFQILKRHFEKYTPQVCAAICGCRPEDILKVAELLGRNSGRDKTSAFVYATGLTQHAAGTQLIRTAAILQLLLGNIGRPGGGIIALRGHSNVQGATDIPTLYGELPNYIPMPHAEAGHRTLKEYLANGHAFESARDKKSGMWQLETERGAWASLPSYMVSLLKAWYGDNATAENEFGYQWLPKLQGNESMTVMLEKAREGKLDGLLVFGENIAVSNPNTRLVRTALRNLKWLVVCDLFENETASVWYADPTMQGTSADCQTEVFYLPAAMCLEKEGSVTNTERLIQWHRRLKNAPGACQSDAWWIWQLGKILKERAERAPSEANEALRALTWDYARTTPEDFPGLTPIADDIDLVLVAREMNGYRVSDGALCQSSADLADDGSTLCGCRLLSGFMAQDGSLLSERVEEGFVDHELDLAYRITWPTNTRILYNRCSADPFGNPWSERKKLIWWDALQERWVGFDKPNFNEKKAPDYRPAAGARGDAAIAGDSPFGVHTDGKAWLFVPYGIKEGPLPVHYEPAESPYPNALFTQVSDPGLTIIDDEMNPVAQNGDLHFSTVMTTYHVTEHWLSGAQTRNIAWLAGLQPVTFLEISPEKAQSIGATSGDLVTVESARAATQIHALVTPRARIGEVLGKPADVVGTLMCSGYKGIVTDAVTNDLSPAIMAPDGLIPSSKGFSVHVGKGDPARYPQVAKNSPDAPQAFDSWVPNTPWASQPEGRSE